MYENEGEGDHGVFPDISKIKTDQSKRARTTRPSRRPVDDPDYQSLETATEDKIYTESQLSNKQIDEKYYKNSDLNVGNPINPIIMDRERIEKQMPKLYKARDIFQPGQEDKVSSESDLDEYIKLNQENKGIKYQQADKHKKTGSTFRRMGSTKGGMNDTFQSISGGPKMLLSHSKFKHKFGETG